jgi:hypothetical protein
MFIVLAIYISHIRKRTDNTMDNRKRIDNTMDNRKRIDNTMDNRKRIDNTMDNRKRTKGSYIHISYEYGYVSLVVSISRSFPRL